VAASGAISSRTNLTPDIDAHSPWLSRDGDTVALTVDEPLVPADTNAVPDAYVRTTAGSYLLAAPPGAGRSGAYDISPDGRHVALFSESVLTGDTNGTDDDVVVWDRVAGTHRLVTRGGPGVSTEPQLSGNGSVVTFGSAATGLAPGATGTYNVFAAVLR
jgi:Tol biopolymer transport system component